MKILKMALSLLLVFGLFSCSGNDNPDPISNQDFIRNTVQSENWNITNFNDSGIDETKHFAGYLFKFNSNVSMVAENGTNSYLGTWSISGTNSGDDDSFEDIEFNIFFLPRINLKI